MSHDAAAEGLRHSLHPILQLQKGWGVARVLRCCFRGDDALLGPVLMLQEGWGIAGVLCCFRKVDKVLLHPVVILQEKWGIARISWLYYRKERHYQRPMVLLQEGGNDMVPKSTWSKEEGPELSDTAAEGDYAKVPWLVEDDPSWIVEYGVSLSMSSTYPATYGKSFNPALVLLLSTVIHPFLPNGPLTLLNMNGQQK